MDDIHIYVFMCVIGFINGSFEQRFLDGISERTKMDHELFSRSRIDVKIKRRKNAWNYILN